MSLIEVRSLYKRFGEKEALKNINIKVERGEVLAIIGPTGAGKTTLLYLLDLLEMPAHFRVALHGVVAQNVGPFGHVTGHKPRDRQGEGYGYGDAPFKVEKKDQPADESYGLGQHLDHGA